MATGETHTVREFAELTFGELGINLEWDGKDERERGIIKEIVKTKYDIKNKKLKQGVCVIEVDDRYYRPTEVDLLIGDYTKAKNLLGWEPKVKFDELIKIMIESDYEKVLKRGF